MAKRYREFRRVKFTAVVGHAIREKLVDKTFNDHFTVKKCEGEDCPHMLSGSLQAARFVESAITVSQKRGYLDIPCPYTQGDSKQFVKLLEVLVKRLKGFASVEKNSRTKGVMLRVCEEIDAYAHRNAMEVLAETRVDCD